MAKACGLRIGPRGYELVLLDGSAKKHKVVASEAGELSISSDPSGAVEILKGLAAKHDIPKDALRVVVEGGQASFRKVNLPINDDDKIDKVIKFEVESELPQFNIEDVVVDWQRLSSTKDSCSLLTTIVKKDDLQGILDVCEKSGVEPIEVDADTSAIVNAAAAAGALDPESASLIVYVGEESSSLAVLDGGELRELRSIKQGAMTHIPIDAGKQTEEVPDETEPGEGEEESLGGEAAASIEDEPTLPADQHAQQDQVLGRLQREIARSISGARTLQPLNRVLIAGYEMPGLIGSEILEVPVEALNGLPDTASCASRCAAAYGAAVAQLGGGLMRVNLRKEELRFTGTMERLELPLAVAGLLLVTFLGVWNIGLGKEFDKVNNDVCLWRDFAVHFMIPEKKEQRGNLTAPPKWLLDYTARTTRIDPEGKYKVDPVRSSYEQMTYMRGKLRQDVTMLEKKLGQGIEGGQPQSALKGVTYVLDVLDDTREVGARPSIRYLKASYNRATNSEKDNVIVTMDVTFFAEDTVKGTEHFEAFRRAIEDKPWHMEFNPARTDPLENGEGIIVERITIKMDVSLTEEATS